MKRFCIIWLVLMSLTWIVCQFVRVSGRCVVGNHTLNFAFDHGGLWFMRSADFYGPTTLVVDTNAFGTNGATLAPPMLAWNGWNMATFAQWGVIPYWLVAVPAAFGLCKYTRRPPRGFTM